MEIGEEGLYVARYAAVAVVGQVVRGTVKPGDSLDLVGFTYESKRVVIINILSGLGAIPGLPFYLLDKSITKQEIHRGQVLVSPGSVRPTTMFQAEVIIDERYEQIRQKPFQGVYRYPFYLRYANFFGTLCLPPGKQQLVRGDHFTTTVELQEPCGLEVGLHFGIGRLLGHGIVLEVVR